jgi:hypothetical protein
VQYNRQRMDPGLESRSTAAPAGLIYGSRNRTIDRAFCPRRGLSMNGKQNLGNKKNVSWILFPKNPPLKMRRAKRFTIRYAHHIP